MIIECPACGARAKLPDSKEGAKVRCIECERVYVARASGRGGSAKGNQSNMALPIGIGVGVLALILILVMMQGGDKKATIPDAPEVRAKPVVEAGDLNGWDSPLVKRARKLHELAYSKEEYTLQNSISWPHVWARQQITAAQLEDPEVVLDIAGYSSLSSDDIDIFRGDVLRSLSSIEASNLVGSWKPFDGSVVAESDTTGRVRLSLELRDEEEGSSSSRGIEWRFIKKGSNWKAWSWARWISPEEAKAARVARTKSYDQKTLSDGSVVIEGEPKPIPYMDETTEDQRKSIDTLIVELIDLELPAKRLSTVKSELSLHGKHAIPALLTKFYYMSQEGFPDMDAAIRAMLVHKQLGEITGYVTSFSAHEVLGATKERRDSGVRQWWGWYNKKFKKFDMAEEQVDAMEESVDLEAMSDRERREYLKMKRLIEQEEADQNRRRDN